MADKEETSKTEIPNSVAETLETRIKICSLLAPVVIGINTLGIISCLAILYTLSTDLTLRSGVDLIETVKSDYIEFEKLDTLTRESMDGVRNLESKMDYELSARGIEEVAELIQNTEQNAQLFLRLLKVNMYNLAGFIPGTASWYELYAPEVDDAIERSRSRQLKLLALREFYENPA